MQKYDFSSLHDAHSLIVSGGAKSGKMTFLFYLLTNFYKQKAAVFTPQESFVFDKKIKTLSDGFEQFGDIKNIIDIYYFRDDFAKMKQQYGYPFLLKEFEKIITQSDEDIIVLHRFGEYFDFQDRHEISGFYKGIVRLANINDKKIIFLVNNKNENFRYIHDIAEDITDMLIEISKNEKNERLLNLMDILYHKEYPLLKFSINDGNLVLQYKDETKEITQQKEKKILIAELDKAHDNMRQICSYIFDKPNFTLKYADSLQGMLQEIFIKPDVIIVLMKREQQNMDTIKAIKMNLPDTSIVSILDQEFIRTEDIHEIVGYGCDEVFANNLKFDSVVLALQKATRTLFYTQMLNSLTKHKNIMKSLDELKGLALECVEKSIFFTAFVLQSDSGFAPIKETSRKTDYIYLEKNKLYCLALNTMPKDAYIIADKFKKQNPDLYFRCIWEPINSAVIEECLDG